MSFVAQICIHKFFLLFCLNLLDAGGRKFRNPKRYTAIPSPLVAVDWWRVRE